MAIFPEHTLAIYADGNLTDIRVRTMLESEERVGLLPWQSILRFVSLPEEAELALARCKEIEVRSEDKVLCFGKNMEVFRKDAARGDITTVVFSSGIALWEAQVSLSLEAGTSISETVQALLEISGINIPLASFPAADPVCPRGQAFFGRAAESISLTLSAARARGYLTPSGLCVIPDSGLPISMTLEEDDLIGAPEFTKDGNAILRTVNAGWTVGKFAEVRWKGQSISGLIRERMQNIDTGSDAWNTELLLEVKND